VAESQRGIKFFYFLVRLEKLGSLASADFTLIKLSKFIKFPTRPCRVSFSIPMVTESNGC